MKILELTNFSAGACGVWMRVKQESELLVKKGHIVKVFSSNFVKGTNEIAKDKEKLGKIEIKRFKALMPGRKPLHFIPGGESYMFWDFRQMMKEVKKFQPQVIIAHSYSHPHTLFALRAAKLTKARVFLVTHAPFDISGNRSFWGHKARWFFDFFIGKNSLNKFDRIIAITKWEMPILEKLNVPKEKIVYIPNGIPKEFFIQKKSKEEKKVLFLGRIAPIKDLETLIRASKLLPNVNIELVGPAEEKYLAHLKSLNPPPSFIFLPPVYDLKKKIEKIDSAKIFVLPSIRESMPQSLIEAMAREKIVIASNNLGAKELIEDGKNGFFFEIGNEKQLAEKISFALKKDLLEIKRQAKKSVEKFSWDKIIGDIERLITNSHK
jgi:glycosyltransferase involved in cell wall biosynthesis